MSATSPYRHTQHAPWCFMLYGLSVMFFTTSWFLRDETIAVWLFVGVGFFMVLLAASFHHLTVEDEGDRLRIAFGPVPLFRRTVRYADITSVSLERTTVFDGWGIHMSLRGGWVWNIWGRDCVTIWTNRMVLRVGSDDAARLAEFLGDRLAQEQSSDSENGNYGT